MDERWLFWNLGGWVCRFCVRLHTGSSLRALLSQLEQFGTMELGVLFIERLGYKAIRHSVTQISAGHAMRCPEDSGFLRLCFLLDNKKMNGK